MVNVAKRHKCDEKFQRLITKPTRSVSINSVGTNMLFFKQSSFLLQNYFLINRKMTLISTSNTVMCYMPSHKYTVLYKKRTR